MSLRDSLNIATPGAGLVYHAFGAATEFERDLILERTMAGLEEARARSREGERSR